MKLTLKRLSEQLVQVQSPAGELLGHLKLIGGIWKFKAIGFAADGGVIPGGGPLTHRHNTVFQTLDEALVSAALGPG